MKSLKKGKTYEEMYGIEKARRLKTNSSIKTKQWHMIHIHPRGMLGKHLSKETKLKKSKIAKEKGIGLWMKGRKLSEETKRKMSLSRINKPLSIKHRINISNGKKGIKLSEEHKRKIIKNLIHGWNKGKKAPWVTKRNLDDNPMKIKNNIEKMRLKKIGTKSLRKGLTYENQYGIKEAKIKKEKISNSLKGKILEESRNWQGGLSFEPYDTKFNLEFKNLVRLRDNFCCLNCGVSEQKHIILFGRRLTIHHIDYNKLNTCLINCCALCTRCNLLANRNRNEWKEYYHNKLSSLYGYKYSEDNRIEEKQAIQQAKLMRGILA